MSATAFLGLHKTRGSGMLPVGQAGSPWLMEVHFGRCKSDHQALPLRRRAEAQ